MMESEYIEKIIVRKPKLVTKVKHNFINVLLLLLLFYLLLHSRTVKMNNKFRHEFRIETILYKFGL